MSAEQVGLLPVRSEARCDVLASTTAAPAQTIDDTALWAVATVARHFGVHADERLIRSELGLIGNATEDDALRALALLGLKATYASNLGVSQLSSLMQPAILHLADGQFVVASEFTHERCLLQRIGRDTEWLALERIAQDWSGRLILITREPAERAAEPPETYGIGWYFSALLKHRQALFHIVIASLFVQVLALATPILTQVVLDKVVIHHSLSTLIVVVVGLVVLGVFDVILQYLRSIALAHTASRLDVEFGRRIFRHLLRLSSKYFDENAAGQISARIREIDTIRNFLTGQSLTSLLDIVFSILFFLVLFGYSPSIALIVLSAIPAYFLIISIIRPIIRQRTAETFAASAQVQQLMVETIVSAQMLKAMAAEGLMGKEWDERRALLAQRSFLATTTASLGLNLVQTVSKVVAAAVLYVGAKEVMAGDMTIGQYIAATMLSAQVVAPVIRISQLWRELQQVHQSVARLGEVLNSPVENAPGLQANFAPIQGRISFRNVQFRYREDGANVLDKIDLDIPAGQVLGVVGSSGSGKSTLTKIIQRMYLPQGGAVMIDGVDIKLLHPTWIRQHLGVVLQDNVLLNRTVHENIALGLPLLTKEAIVAASKLAGADEFVVQLPLGYDTMIEERGLNLSGGQRQRIAIARALARDPRILILDEATSAVDYETERLIQRNLGSIVSGRTVIIVAHRLVSVRSCDRIVVLDKGRIIEDGTHDELMELAGGFYRRLWEMQTQMATR